MRSSPRFPPCDGGKFLAKMPLQSEAGQRIFALRKFTRSTDKGGKFGGVFWFVLHEQNEQFRRKAEQR